MATIVKLICVLLLVPGFTGVLALVDVTVTEQLEQKDREMQQQIDDILSRLGKVEGETQGTADILNDVKDIRENVNTVAYQLMQSQHGAEEYRRHSGGSGVQQVRVSSSGTREYMEESHTGRRMAAMHDHGDHKYVIGLGEFSAVLNGVHFQTRHNDFPLREPDPSNSTFLATKFVEFPDIPPKVKQAGSVNDQIDAMRECFRQWSKDDFSDPSCDIENTFVPVLCYMEGFWTVKKEFVEPFESERHSVDASSWEDLHQKSVFVSATGRKQPAENFAFLPTKIYNVSDGRVETAQWTYRIITVPIRDQNLRRALLLKRFRMVDDLKLRATGHINYDKLYEYRGTRFQLMPDSKSWINYNTDDEKCEWDKEFRYFVKDEDVKMTFLDKVMGTIPGLDHDNPWTSDHQDESFGNVYRMDKMPQDNPPQYKTGKYHRAYKEFVKGAMGELFRRRGFSDHGVYMASNLRPEVAPNTMKLCIKGECNWHTQRWSYAIPMEIVWLTPLQTWNPYNIEYKGPSITELGKTVVADGRNGELTASKAYNGANSKKYFLTPKEFYTKPDSGTVEEDSADTGVTGVKGVLDSGGNVRETVASGVRIVSPEIVGLGRIRTRFPIAPVYGEGGSVWKEVNAIKDVLTKHQQFRRVFRDDPLDQPPCCVKPDLRTCKHKCPSEFRCRVYEYAPAGDMDENLPGRLG